MGGMSPRAALQQKVAWRPKEFLAAVPVSHSQLFEWLKDGTIPSAKIGGARMITESPQDFLARHQKPAD